MLSKLYSLQVAILAIILSLNTSGQTCADTLLFESSKLGQTGLTVQNMISQSIPGSNVSKYVFQGVRFHLDKPVVTTRIGGHFIANEGGGDFFGAIVCLAGDRDFPDSADLSTMDVLGTTQLTFPNPSKEVFGELNLNLDTGWFALIFGSGLFSTSGKGATVQNGTDVSSLSYLGWQPSGPYLGWLDYSNSTLGHQFFLFGNVIPEPSTFALILIMAVSCLSTSRY